MGHQDHGPLVRIGEVAEQLHRLRLQLRVQAGRRLIQEQEAGAADQLRTDAGTLALAAGEPVDPSVLASLQRQLAEHPPHGGQEHAPIGVVGQP